MIYTYTIPLRPIGKGRPRHGNGRTWTPDATRKWERDAAAAVRRGPLPGLAEPVHVTIEAAFGSTSPSDAGVPHVSRPDLDNIVKIVLDVLVSAGVLADDKYASKICASKRKVWIGDEGAHVYVQVDTIND